MIKITISPISGDVENSQEHTIDYDLGVIM